MNALDNFLKVIDKMPKEQQQKAVPLLKLVSVIIDNNNEMVKRRYEFNSQFTAVVGVVFGVLAAFNNIGNNKCADIIYIIGLVCCGLCLVCCVIGLYQPVHNAEVKKDNNILKAFNELIVVFTLGQKNKVDDETKTEQIEEIKPSRVFKWLHIFSYILFGIAVACMVTKVIILYAIAY